jgi:glycosyltransferase involved in cell wall biosynthesis
MTTRLFQISVIIPTYNRAESLKDTLQGLQRQNLFQSEIIVVDNNSTDDTKKVVEEMQSPFGSPLRYVFEPKQGVAAARNTGVRFAQGKWVAFLDDDVIPEPGWLKSLLDCFQETNADLVGGKVDLLWLSERPSWLSKRLMTPLVSTDFGEKRFQVRPGQLRFVGANFACRRGLFDSAGLFREELGRRKNSLIGGEDYEWFDRAVKAKAKIFYEPGAKVFHKVWGEKVTEEYILRWFRDIGRTHGHLMDWKWHHGATILPIWCWGKIAFAAVRQTGSGFFDKDKTKKLEAETEHLFYQGILEERTTHWQSKLFHRRLSCHFVNEHVTYGT